VTSPTGGAGRERLAILQVDAFARAPFAGNPAGVVLDAAGLSEHEMRLIAREMNVSETAFLMPPEHGEADVRVRGFTPATEVDLCGHATVATFHAALEEGRLAPGTYRMECASGVLPIDLTKDAEGRPVVRMGLPVPDLGDPLLAGCRIAEPLGIETDDLSDRLPVMRAGPWALVPVSGLDVMRRMRPDFKALRELGGQTGMGNTIVFTTETVEKRSLVHLRMFAPGYGIDEDPVTGSAQGPLAAYLVAKGLLRPDQQDPLTGRSRYVAEQGDMIGRPGRVDVEVATMGERAASITIIGQAVTVLKGTITIPL